MTTHRTMPTRTTRLVCLTIAIALTAFAGFSAPNVFDMPSFQMRHLQLLAQVNVFHEQGDYAAMEVACLDGIKTGTCDELWYYNLACALALQGKTEEALPALDHAIEAGFLDVEHVSQDSDLDALRKTGALDARVARMNTLRHSAHPRFNQIVALAPDASHTVLQTASNTLWSFETALFHTLIDLPTTNPPTAFAGPEADAINAWCHDGTAAGAAGLLYVNRDTNMTPLDVARYPGLTRLGYAQEVLDRRLALGLPNTLFSNAGSSTPIPVIGHSSMGYLNSAYWRSQPRAVCGDPRQAMLQPLLLLGNQFFFYPAFSDYNMQTGDLFPANTPCLLTVAGQSGSEQPFVEAAVAALCAMRPETRAELTRHGTLMPTLSMLFRASQRTLKTPRDYLTGMAHPVAFLPQNLDTSRLVHMAHALTTNSLPPVVFLGVQRETQMTADLDFFDLARTEQLFDTPFAIARVFRGAAHTRTLELEARCKRTHVKFHWVVLQGDPAKITFTPCPTNAALMTLTVAHHEPFELPLGNEQSIRTARIDIGVIAEADGIFSMPSILSFCFLANERRTYAQDGRVLSIDYTRPLAGYTDPLLSCPRNWKDVYQYDAQGRLTGWRRIRGLQEETFTAYGHRVVARDSLGRPARAHIVHYLPRKIRSGEVDEGLPDLAEVDDNLAVSYRYASDDDRVGSPDSATLSRRVQLPEPAVSP